MPKIGKNIMPYEKQPSFQGQNPAVAEANKMGQELGSIPLEGIEPEFPTINATERMETYQIGGKVKKY